jgi:hypothetical protein
MPQPASSSCPSKSATSVCTVACVAIMPSMSQTVRILPANSFTAIFNFKQMPPTKPPMPKNQRRAYHEAGHAILAAQYKIGIQRVAIKQLPGKLNRSIFQTAADYCTLRVGHFVDDDIRLERFISFLMAGTAADMLALENYRGYQQIKRSFQAAPTTTIRYSVYWLKN